MKAVTPPLAALALFMAAAAQASEVDASVSAPGPQASRYVQAKYAENEALPYLQCVPYARKVSGIQIYGDAWTWWDQAENRYARGNRPRVGAVMSFRPHGNMRLGHVAAISRVLDSRTVLLRHANWSLIDGRRGQIEDDVRATDVSPDNDWSAVRVWFAPIASLGTTHWPLNGFIYPDPVRPGKARTVIASASANTPAPPREPRGMMKPDPIRRDIIRPDTTRSSQSAKGPSVSGEQTIRPVRLASAERTAMQVPAVPVSAGAGSSRIGSDFLKGIRPEVSATRAGSTLATRQLSARTAKANPARVDQPVRTGQAVAAKSAPTKTASVKTGQINSPAAKSVAPARATLRPAAPETKVANSARSKPAKAQATRIEAVATPPVRRAPQRGTAIRGDDPIGRIIASRSR